VSLSVSRAQRSCNEEATATLSSSISRQLHLARVNRRAHREWTDALVRVAGWPALLGAAMYNEAACPTASQAQTGHAGRAARHPGEPCASHEQEAHDCVTMSLLVT
jgi:hypothetical protein